MSFQRLYLEMFITVSPPPGGGGKTAIALFQQRAPDIGLAKPNETKQTRFIGSRETNRRVTCYGRNGGAWTPSQVARPFGRRVADGSALRQRAGATMVTEMCTEICSSFWRDPMMRKVGGSLSKHAFTPLRLCTARVRVARAPFATWRAC